VHRDLARQDGHAAHLPELSTGTSINTPMTVSATWIGQIASTNSPLIRLQNEDRAHLPTICGPGRCRDGAAGHG